MTAILGANGLLSAQAPNPPLKFSGGPGSTPAGTTTATYDAYGEDVFSDDKLVLGEPVTITAAGWTTGVLPLECVVIKFWDARNRHQGHGMLNGAIPSPWRSVT
jgi:hypothetical protein